MVKVLMALLFRKSLEDDPNKLNVEHIRYFESDTFSKLTHVILPWNNIMDEGTEILAEILSTNRSVQYLDLTGNNISDAGARHLGRTLRCNTTLQGDVPGEIQKHCLLC